MTEKEDKIKPLTEKQKKNLIDIEKYAEMVRFRSIESAIIVERLISNILVEFIGNEKTKKSLEKHLFYDTLTFDQKINLFNSLNKAKFFYNNYNKELNSDLVKMKVIRNYMAHSMIYTDNEFLERYNGREIQFKSYTSREMISNITFKIYENEDDVDNLIFSLNAVILRFNRVYDWLNKILTKEVISRE
jgi:hypothetical protein